MTADGADGASHFVPEHRLLGRYELRCRVGTGGMASVYVARLAASGGFTKWVAIKTVHPHIAHEPRFLAMFLDEARLVARIDHPNVCQVFDFGEADGVHYLAMEYLHGEPLDAVLRRAWETGGLPAHLAARIVADAARGLHAAHELRTPSGAPADVVHRDVSPQNIAVLYNGATKVMDFGVARSRERLGEHTAEGTLRGKLAYMAPEQIERAPIDRRADVWSLGVVLWESLTGRRLFRRANEARTMMAVMRDEVPSPRTVRPDCPEPLAAVAQKALARDPDARYPTAAAFADDLERALVREGHAAGASEVAAFLREICGDLLRAREAMLRSAGGDDPTIETVLRDRWDPTSDVVAPPPSAGPTPMPLPPRRPRALVPLVLVGGLALAVAATLAGMALAHRTTDVARTTPPAPPTRVDAPPPAPAPSPPAAAPSSPDASAAAPPASRTHASNAAPHAHTAAPPGYLDLVVMPSAEVFEAGRSLGFSPLSRQPLAPGVHHLRVVSPARHASSTFVVTIRSGAVTSRALTLP